MAKWPDFESDSKADESLAPKPPADAPDFEPLELAKPLARGKASDLGDVMSIADALADLGHYDKGKHGNPPLVPESLFRAIEDFQHDQGLDVDGTMLPGGPTLGRINTLLPKARPGRVRGDFLQSEPPKPRPADPDASVGERHVRQATFGIGRSTEFESPWNDFPFGTIVPGRRGGGGVPIGVRPTPGRPASPSPFPAPIPVPILPTAPGSAAPPVRDEARRNDLLPVPRELLPVLPGVDGDVDLSNLVEVVPPGAIPDQSLLYRRGNSATRAQLQNIADIAHDCFARHDLETVHDDKQLGPGRVVQRGSRSRGLNNTPRIEVPERRIPWRNPDTGAVERGTRRGASFADIEFTFPSRRRILINTATTLRNGVTPTPLEMANGRRMIANLSDGSILLIIPKPSDNGDPDISDLCARLTAFLEELNQPYDPSNPADRMRFLRALQRQSRTGP